MLLRFPRLSSTFTTGLRKKRRGTVRFRRNTPSLIYYERAEALRLWALREDQINLLQERFGEKKRSVDLQQLRMSLERFTDIPSCGLNQTCHRSSQAEQEALLGERIWRDIGEDRAELYQELITYLALRGRISARATLSLTAYVLATTLPRIYR